MINFFSRLGNFVREKVLDIAGLLTDPAIPGLATLALLIALVCVAVVYLRTTASRLAAINWLRRLIAEADQRQSFAWAIADLDRRITAETKGAAREHIAIAWLEYRETLVAHDEDGIVTLRNSVRPSIFFNPEDLHFGPGGWRTIPGLFVSIGLLLTFLGLIAALGQIKFDNPEQITGALKRLLSVASAKFIMSLTGLFCSIVFTIVLRRRTSAIDRAIHKLCATIEARLTFISLEDLAVEQLRATREQRDHFRSIGMELVAELRRPLKEELPLAISNSITAAMTPLLQKVGQAGADGMDEMVKDLSERFSDDVGRALSKASERLVEAGDRIAALSDRMDQSSGRVGTEIESAVARLTDAVGDLRSAMGSTAQTTSGAFAEGTEKLLSVMNQTLEGIRENTSEGARALSAAAIEMREAAKGFKSEIESASKEGRDAVRQQMAVEGEKAAGAIGSAGVTVLEAFGRTSREISERADKFAEKAERELIAPLGEIGERLNTLTIALTEGATGMRRLSDGVRTGAEASESAASNFRSAAQDLVAAVSPIKNANERIELAVAQLERSTASAANAVITSSESTARSAAQTLAAAQEILGGEAKMIETSLNNLSDMLDRMRGQGQRLDEIDAKLGKAFDDYTTNVAVAVESLFGHVRKMQEELAPALDTLRAIVEQAEQFRPESRRGN